MKIIPYLLPYGRCLAPDLVGMGNSGAAPNGSYRFVDHQRYLDAWFEKLEMKKNVILVIHDWGTALGFYWGQRHPERIKAIVYMEGIVRPFRSWDEWPESTRAFFKAQRTPAGEDLILQKNLFIEYLLPLRGVPEEAIEVYRRYYRNPGASRQPARPSKRPSRNSAPPETANKLQVAAQAAERKIQPSIYFGRLVFFCAGETGGLPTLTYTIVNCTLLSMMPALMA
jgi:pimeloyl-ACP methyl ester carboxylesterase